jgi:CDGSH-type Zn-finger protein
MDMTKDSTGERTPRVYRKPKGQIVIEGKVNLTDMEGNPIKHGNRFTLCGCTKSKDMPFCDGSHKF